MPFPFYCVKVLYTADCCLISITSLLPSSTPPLSLSSSPTTGSSSCPMMSCWRSSHRQGTHRPCSLTSESALTPLPSELGDLSGAWHCLVFLRVVCACACLPASPHHLSPHLIPHRLEFGTAPATEPGALEVKTNDILAMCSPENEMVPLQKVLHVHTSTRFR